MVGGSEVDVELFGFGGFGLLVEEVFVGPVCGWWFGLSVVAGPFVETYGDTGAGDVVDGCGIGDSGGENRSTWASAEELV